ncbi:L-fuculose-phosphate aldolase [Brochothrix campestris]|uniref:L-fuculose phosphate aldolase n=1 Tax=Brochothrix campestris FSL F6-1037 TaxID=1265861 RepID=W7CYX3_9LIST|nr:L-fuculose-phosphate aldolase [Brochothrix campestris]EUJ42157.1 L-fuculose phosphate aldolase [Brochothrix campestris FSL F6-1037]
MKLLKERSDIVNYCKQMRRTGLTKGTGGNISIFNRQSNLIAISPSGVAYERMTPIDVVIVDIDGNVIEGIRQPSSEIAMHLMCYTRPNITSVVHTHSTHCMVLAALQWELPAIHYLQALAGGPTVRCAPYETYGSVGLAQTAKEAIADRYACLLANHGLLTIGHSIEAAFSLATQIEQLAEVYLKAKQAGEPQLLDEAEIKRLLVKFETYGQKRFY